MALGTNEMCLGGCDDCLGQRGYGPSVGGCSDGFERKDGCSWEGDGGFGDNRNRAGRCNNGTGSCRDTVGTCKSGCRDTGYRVGRCDGDFGHSGGHMMVAWGTEKAEQEGVMVALAIERTQWGVYGGDFGTAGTQWGVEMVAL